MNSINFKNSKFKLKVKPIFQNFEILVIQMMIKKKFQITILVKDLYLKQKIFHITKIKLKIKKR